MPMPTIEKRKRGLFDDELSVVLGYFFGGTTDVLLTGVLGFLCNLP